MAKKPKILCVDDEQDILDLLTFNLEKEGYEVYSALNGKKGLEVAKRELPDLIILDVMMPEMDGIELARRATELDPDMKVVFITGFAAVALNPDSQAPKDAKILSKPFHLRDLVSEVQKMLIAA